MLEGKFNKLLKEYKHYKILLKELIADAEAGRAKNEEVRLRFLSIGNALTRVDQQVSADCKPEQKEIMWELGAKR